MLEKKDNLEKTDQELVVLALKEKENYKYLMDRYEEKLLRYIMRISGTSHDDAEDVLQDVFIKAFRNLADFNKKLPFSSWIYRIAHNETISHFRKMKARPQAFSSEANNALMDFLKADMNLEREAADKEMQDKIMDAINGLDKKYKAVLVLKYIENKNYQEISDILKKPSGTVATLLNRAKKQLKNRCKNC